MFFITHRRSQMAPTTQLLQSCEDLTMPGVQAIVLNANMCCLHCRDRVSKVISKMDNLPCYVVNVTQKKVTVIGRVDPKKRMHRIRLMAHAKRKQTIELKRPTNEGYSTGLLQLYKWKVEPADNLIQRPSCFRCSSS